ncbi:MAG: FAS1-like dehydratase domain-containing protein [Chloroflexota bacterium]
MSDELHALRRMIGSQAPPVHYAISAASLSYFADSLMDTDRRYHGEHPSAPPVFFGSAFDLVDMPAGDRRTMFGLSLPLPAGWSVIATGDDFEMHAPVKPGMSLTCTERFVDAWEKQGRSGRLLFFVVEKVFRDGDGSTILRRRIAGAAREPTPLASAGQTVPQQEQPEGISFPTLTVGPVYVRHLAMFATATAEFVDIHYDADYARSVGLPGPIVQGLYKTALIGQMLARRAGEAGRITKLSVEHRGIDLAGNTLTVGGRTSARSEQSDYGISACEVWVRNQDGIITTHGSATIRQNDEIEDGRTGSQLQ